MNLQEALAKKMAKKAKKKEVKERTEGTYAALHLNFLPSTY
jgi:hypothetical protein